jgi:hypothetical protein
VFRAGLSVLLPAFDHAPREVQSDTDLKSRNVQMRLLDVKVLLGLVLAVLLLEPMQQLIQQLQHRSQGGEHCNFQPGLL